jgi:hypothetical protein
MTKEEAKRFGLQLLHGIMERNESYPIYANNVKQAIDALSESSGSSEIPKDLEEAALSRMRDPDMYLSDAVIDEFGDELLKMALFGAKWQKEQDDKELSDLLTIAHLQGAEQMKEQMMKEAVEGEVMLNPYPTICLDDCKDYDFKDGDEVRIIII